MRKKALVLLVLLSVSMLFLYFGLWNKTSCNCLKEVTGDDKLDVSDYTVDEIAKLQQQQSVVIVKVVNSDKDIDEVSGSSQYVDVYYSFDILEVLENDFVVDESRCLYLKATSKENIHSISASSIPLEVGSVYVITLQNSLNTSYFHLANYKVDDYIESKALNEQIEEVLREVDEGIKYNKERVNKKGILYHELLTNGS